MRSKMLFYFILLISVSMLLTPLTLFSQDKPELSVSADLVSRYVWRGLSVNDAPNIQPSASLGFKGLGLGVWGSSALSKTIIDSSFAFNNEVDFWMGYTLELSKGMAIVIVVTDYYFPDAGIKIGNFNNYDADDGAGAHTLEAGVTFAGPDSFPLSFSAFMNLYNDEGNNTYFEVAYSTELSGVGLDIFAGATAGSDKNPGYYGTKDPKIINFGFSATKAIEITEKFELPVFTSVILNPRTEYLTMVLGISL